MLVFVLVGLRWGTLKFRVRLWADVLSEHFLNSLNARRPAWIGEPGFSILPLIQKGSVFAAKSRLGEIIIRALSIWGTPVPLPIIRRGFSSHGSFQEYTPGWGGVRCPAFVFHDYLLPDERPVLRCRLLSDVRIGGRFRYKARASIHRRYSLLPRSLWFLGEGHLC